MSHKAVRKRRHAQRRLQSEPYLYIYIKKHSCKPARKRVQPAVFMLSFVRAIDLGTSANKRSIATATGEAERMYCGHLSSIMYLHVSLSRTESFCLISVKTVATPIPHLSIHKVFPCI